MVSTVMAPVDVHLNGATGVFVGSQTSERSIPLGNLFSREVNTANRRFEMHKYRQIISRMRLGESNRQIARAGIMGRKKAAQVDFGKGPVISG
jgi:hypothetical protein